MISGLESKVASLACRELQPASAQEEEEEEEEEKGEEADEDDDNAEVRLPAAGMRVYLKRRGPRGIILVFSFLLR